MRVVKHCRIVASLWPALLVTAAHADFIYVAGTQTSTGSVQAILAPNENFSDAYNLAAPDPLASWSPPSQNISAAVSNGANAGVQSSYLSTVEPGHIFFHETAAAHAINPTIFTGGASFTYDQTFSLSFHIDVPTEVAYSARLQRQHPSGWPSGTPGTIEFGPDGGPMLVSLAYNGFAIPDYVVSQPLTYTTLQPGDYHITILSHNTWGAGRGASFAENFTFELQIVPAPASLAGMGLLTLVFGGRKRAASS